MSKNTEKAEEKPAGIFFQTRMDALGVTPLNNKITLINPEIESPGNKSVSASIFEEDSKGNICINFYNLERELITYYKKGNGKMSALNQKLQTYQQIRLQFPTGDMKYVLPRKKGIFPFLPPLIIEAWKKKTPIHTLYLTEGAFKAWKACLHGIYTIGLTSITHYRDSETKALHQDIINLIIKCKVQRVVILWDGDCRNISKNHLRDMVDIAKRPRDFFNTVKGIRKLLLDIELPKNQPDLEICFFHINPQSFPDAPKGLDDILIEGEKMGNAAAVTKELMSKKIDRSFFFYKSDITNSTATLFQYFKLNELQAFYHFHSDSIKNTQFNFQKNFWKWNETKSELELIMPAWATQIRWIGDSFYKEIQIPSLHEKFRRFLKLTSKQTLIDLYGADFQKYLNYYEGFCNIPNNFNYQSEYSNFYNLYRPIPVKPAKGDCTTTLDFIKHIFGEHIIEHEGKSYQSYELGLDYLHLLFNCPEKILPVLILYSPESSTGKSTFGKWQKYLLGENAIKVDNSDIKSEFNEHWASKLLVYCEETFLERKTEVETIKAHSTSAYITVNPKGVKRYGIDFFSKFQFYSNKKKMIYVNKHDDRFWIRRVPVPKLNNPKLLEELKAEAPAFLDFILHRPLATQSEARMHFHPHLIQTATFHEMVKINEPTDVRSLREKIKMMFLDFGQSRILLPVKAINHEFFGGKSQIHRLKEILKEYLKVDQLRNEAGKLVQVRSEYYRWEREIDGQGQESLNKRIIKFRDRPFVFHRKDFINAEEEFVEEQLDKISRSKETLKLDLQNVQN